MTVLYFPTSEDVNIYFTTWDMVNNVNIVCFWNQLSMPLGFYLNYFLCSNMD